MVKFNITYISKNSSYVNIASSKVTVSLEAFLPDLSFYCNLILSAVITGSCIIHLCNSGKTLPVQKKAYLFLSI